MASQPTIIQSTGGAAGGFSSTYALAFTNPVTAGNKLVAIGYASGSGGTVASATDSLGNTYTLRSPTGRQIGFLTATAASSGSCTVTLQASTACDYRGLALAEVSTDSGEVVQYSSYIEGYTSPSAASMTPHGCLIESLMFGAIETSAGTITPLAGWTEIFEYEAHPPRSFIAKGVAAFDSEGPSWSTVPGAGTMYGFVITYVTPPMEYIPSSIEYCSNQQFQLPAGADGINIGHSTTAWANSAWVELEDSTPEAWVLTGAEILESDIDFLQSEEFSVDIGVGSLGNEVVIATFKGLWADSAFQVPSGLAFELPIPIDAIPASSRVTARIRKSRNNGFDWLVGISYYKKPLVGLITTTTKPMKTTSDAAAMPTLTSSATPWANPASFTQLIASAAADLVVVGGYFAGTQAGADIEFDIAVGGVGSEVVVLTIPVFVRIGEPGWTPFRIPLDGILSGQRVSARMRSGNASINGQVALSYIEKPL
jgi:hypothetical protein